MTGKLASSVFCLLFAIPFGLGGGFAIYSMTVHLGGWIETRSWQPVMAEVLEVRLNESRSRKSTTYRVEARYRYDANGVSYTGSRVGYTTMGDNVGSWQEDIYRELDDARGSGRKVLAWADPDQPAAAMIDRRLRWGILLLLLPFATLFPLVSAGALWLLLKTWREA